MEYEDERTDKLVEERLQQEMERRGMLISETGGPSGAAISERDAYAKFAAGKITEEQARKLGVTFT